MNSNDDPRALQHLVARFEDAYDVDDPNRDSLIDFVNKHFIAEMPCFEGEDCQNIYAII